MSWKKLSFPGRQSTHPKPPWGNAAFANGGKQSSGQETELFDWSTDLLAARLWPIPAAKTAPYKRFKPGPLNKSGLKPCFIIDQWLSFLTIVAAAKTRVRENQKYQYEKKNEAATTSTISVSHMFSSFNL
jgi:hypothetical protein